MDTKRIFTRPRRLVLPALAATVCCAAVALAAGAPAATTTAATNVGATTATLNGTVSPNGNDTTYQFQYGTTTSYGQETPKQGPIQGNSDRSVSANVTGLTASTTYHYRLVATSTAGTSNGPDMTFMTAAPGASTDNAVDATTSDDVLTFGHPVTVSGTVTGPNATGVTVTLEESPAPYTGGFRSTGRTATTDANGDYSIMVSPLANTHYRVVAKAKKKVTSGEAGVRVRVKTSLRITDRSPRAGQRVVFTGSVLPAHDGAVVRIQRRTAAGRWRTVSRTTLYSASPVGATTRSAYTKKLRIRRDGTYRVRVAPADGDHVAGNSSRKSVVVH